MGVAVAALQVLYDEEGRYRGAGADGSVDGGGDAGESFLMKMSKGGILVLTLTLFFCEEQVRRSGAYARGWSGSLRRDRRLTLRGRR